MNTALLLGSFFLLLLLNVPIAWSLGGAVIIYIAKSDFMSLDFIATTMFTGADSFPLMAVPLFILGGALMQGGGIAKRLIDLAEALVGHLRGGLAIATILGCMFFGAVSGSSTATVATIGTLMVPAMLERGYSKGFAYGLIAAAGCLGVLIPPSIPVVNYGVATNASISTLFMGAMGVGFLVGILLMIFAYVICRREGYEGNGLKFSFKRVLKAFTSAIGALMVPVIILGGIYSGLFTPTEAAAIAVFYAVLAGFFIYRELTIVKLLESLSDSSVTTSSIMVVVATATALARVLTLERVPMQLSAFVTGFTDSTVVLLILINVALLITCCVMEVTPAILILAPLLLPIARSYGVDPIHFGVMMVFNCTIGFITPPVGVNLFVATSMGNIDLATLVKNLLPFLIAMLIALVLVTYIPTISLFFPRLFLGYGR